MKVSLTNRLFKKYSKEDSLLIKAIKNIIGVKPGNVLLYKMAFRHKSVATEIKQGFRNSNERLEYLGDAVLGCIIADYLFKKFPFKEEGFLTEMRSRIVNRNSLNKLSEKMGINKLVKMNADTYHQNRFASGNAFEALIGAIYIDKGYYFTRKVILHRIIKYHIDMDVVEQTDVNYKSRILEWGQRERKTIEYVIVNEPGNGSRMYRVQLLIDGEIKGEGQDFSKKNAEQMAAERAMENIKIIETDEEIPPEY